MSDAHRKSCKRQHRVIGNFLSMQAWLLGVDCIVLIRSDLEKFLGLKRFRSTRIKWLLQDLRPWFRYQEDYYSTSSSPSSIHTLFLSRVPIKPYLTEESMTTSQRINRMPDEAPKTKLFSKAPLGKMHDESQIVSQLAQLASGLIEPSPKIRRIRGPRKIPRIRGRTT